MVLGKDENIFCVADAQATIERLVAEPKITAYRAMKVIEVQHYLLCQCSTTPIAHAVLLLSHMKYYSYRTCSTTPIFLPLFADFN